MQNSITDLSPSFVSYWLSSKVTPNCIIIFWITQEYESELYAELDVLLTLEEYRMAVPDTLACYLPYGTYIIYETTPLPIKSIIGLCTKPLSLLRWDSSNKTLLRLPEQVSVYNDYMIMIGIYMIVYYPKYSVFEPGRVCESPPSPPFPLMSKFAINIHGLSMTTLTHTSPQISVEPLLWH